MALEDTELEDMELEDMELEDMELEDMDWKPRTWKTWMRSLLAVCRGGLDRCQARQQRLALNAGSTLTSKLEPFLHN